MTGNRDRFASRVDRICDAWGRLKVLIPSRAASSDHEGQLVTPLSTAWKKVVASSTSTGTVISGVTNFFLGLAASFKSGEFSDAVADVSAIRSVFSTGSPSVLSKLVVILGPRCQWFGF